MEVHGEGVSVGYIQVIKDMFEEVRRSVRTSWGDI